MPYGPTVESEKDFIILKANNKQLKTVQDLEV